jgi:hypothetical protein
MHGRSHPVWALEASAVWSFTPGGGHTTPVTGENRLLVVEEPVEFEKSPVGVQDFSKATHHFRGIHRIYPNLIKKNRKMSTWNRLDLESLGYRLIMSKFFSYIGTLVSKWSLGSQGKGITALTCA